MSFVGVTNGITTGLNIISQGKDLYDSFVNQGSGNSGEGNTVVNENHYHITKSKEEIELERQRLELARQQASFNRATTRQYGSEKRRQHPTIYTRRYSLLRVHCRNDEKITMEAKLAVYQLSAPCTTCNGGGMNGFFDFLKANPEKKAQRQQTRLVRQEQRQQKRVTRQELRSQKGGNIFERNNITVGSTLERATQLLNLAGGAANVISAFKSGQPVRVNGEDLSDEERQYVYETAIARQNGTLTENSSNDMFQQLMLAKMLDDNKKDNTPLYIGLGVAALLVVVLMMNKK